jgi:4-amino-4-deoxy-L-arabinose transferase-like glycosyltransferase
LKGLGGRLLLTLLGIKLVAHAVTLIITPYEVHRDEFLYLAMGDHLNLWGMDFPPFIAILANVQRFLFGDHLWSIRVFPALAGAVLVWLAVDTARRLGGKVPAQAAAGLVILLSPLFLRVSALFQPVVFDQLWWSLALWALLRRGLDDEPTWWIAVGAALGMGLLTKFSIAFIAIPVALATLVTGLRRDLATPWPWIGLTLSLALGLPSLAGQTALGWPFFDQMADLQSSQLAGVTWSAFLSEQALMVGPGVILALAGLVALLGRRRSPALQGAGLAALGAFLFLLVLHGKPYYAGPVYPVLVGAGAAALSNTAYKKPQGRGLRGFATSLGAWGTAAILVLQIAFGLVTLPMGLPVVPREPMARYSKMLGVTSATRTNVGVQLELPQDYADMLSWEEFADSVAGVWSRLPEEERRSAVLLATNYGRAGALDWYGPDRGLPPSVAPIGSYWFWGPGDREWDVAVVAGSDSAGLATYFRDVRQASRIRDPWRVPEERDVGIFVVREPLEPIGDVWPRFQGRN